MAEGKQVALITGATSGIGAATAALLGAAGVHVVVSGRDGDRGRRVVDEVRGAGGTADFFAATLHDGDSARRLASQSLGVAGHVDMLINNAAMGPLGPTPGIAEADFDACYALNVKVPFYLVGAIAPTMVERGHGVIVNVSTMVAGFGIAGSAVYASSKAALNLLTKAWAAEFGPHGVRVNAVAPGPTLTEGTAATFGQDGLEKLARRAPAGRVATPREIAETIVYLTSDRASFVHGAILPVDGGRAAV